MNDDLADLAAQEEQDDAGKLDVRTLVDVQSPSRVALFLRCQFAWSCRYVHGLVSPPTAAIAWGNAHDRTANDVYSQKARTGASPGSKDAIDRYAARWSEQAREVPDWREESAGKLLDLGVALTRLWAKRAVPYVQPIATQREIRLTVKDPQHERPEFTVRGIIDLVASIVVRGIPTPTVVDHKASRRRITVSDSLRSLAGPVYCAGSGVDAFDLHAGRRNLHSVDWQSVRRTITKAEQNATLALVAKARRLMEQSVRTGDFLPNRQHHLCSRRWCAWWQVCERSNGGRVPE